tara:strand:+ start:4066 stop:4389 length:324 start_codon:yes stop_codon:yes gene_type:complete
MYQLLYRELIRKTLTRYPSTSISNGIVTLADFPDSVYIEKYYHIEPFSIAGPYPDSNLNLLSHIKDKIRNLPASNENIDYLFQVNREYDDILDIIENGCVYKKEFIN